MSVWTQALGRRRGSEVPLPWSLQGMKPRRGHLVVVMGAPGSGKSLLALNWCLSLEQPSLLLSLDTTTTDQATRACSILAGVEEDFIAKRPEVWAHYLEARNLWLRMYDLNVNTRELNDLVLAEEEYWGITPALTVVDNLSNLITDVSYEAYRMAFLGLQKVARMRNTCVVALHHIKRDSTRGPLTLHSGQYSGEQEAEIVLGLWREPGLVNAAVLKNRSGVSDPTGQTSTKLTWDDRTLRIKELTNEYLWTPGA